MKRWASVIVIWAGVSAAGCGVDPEPVSINGNDSGRKLDLAMDQEVDLTLQTIGPGQYGQPSISSSAVEFEGMHFPSEQNPGGPTQIFQFRAVADGTAVITIPHDSGRAPFTVTLGCCAK